jgi:hypothetical protein
VALLYGQSPKEKKACSAFGLSLWTPRIAWGLITNNQEKSFFTFFFVFMGLDDIAKEFRQDRFLRKNRFIHFIKYCRRGQH